MFLEQLVASYYTIEMYCLYLKDMYNSFSKCYRYPKDIFDIFVTYQVYTKNMLTRSSYAWYKPT